MNQAIGRYKVFYKSPKDTNQRQNGSYENKLLIFEGEIENFVTNGNNLCAFRNEENEVLLVNFADIVQMSPIS